MMNKDYTVLIEIQRSFLMKVEDLLSKVIGRHYKKFSTSYELIQYIQDRAISKTFAKQFNENMSLIYSELRSFYGSYAANWFELAKRIGGLKLVFGGISRFSETLLQNANNVLLFSDTIYLADPVLPWIEDLREEERFRSVHLLKNMYFVLSLKDIVDADLSYPPVIIFPSFEKSLEENDPVTQEKIHQLLTSFFSFYLGEKFENATDTLLYTRKHGDLFLEKVENNKLFWPAQADSITTVKKGILEYKEFIQKNRSKEEQHLAENISPAELVWRGIFERIIPHFHVWENSIEFGANPIFSKDSHWHYHNLLSVANNRTMNVSQETLSLSKSLNSFRMNWLNNISVNDLIILRKNNENEKFRKDLFKQLEILDEASLSDIDKVTNEVSRTISGLLNNYNKEIEEIKDKYQLKYKQLLAATIVSSTAQLIPLLQPFTEIIPPIISALKYSYDKLEERHILKKQSKSLMGIFSSAISGK
ncbi:hypothetical protein [Leptospira santarosai]|uniref:hypothetical protein n=1 Tax=Leptospira santarosai TaxID=28183 RepID=UPI00077424CF|nr:hypothetical protein [Leptospira santarosai]MDI7230303.1 hypothetical protein [Leptospira santarosai]